MYCPGSTEWSRSGSGSMAFKCFLLGFVLLCSLWTVGFCNQDGFGFLSLSCGGTTGYVDASNISWVSDGAYISSGKTTSIDYIEGTSSSNSPLRFFPDDKSPKCYKLPVKKNVSSSMVLVRARFVYKNYDRLGKPPVFSVSLGTAITSTVNLTGNDPWIEEFVWPVNYKDTLSFCLHSVPHGGSPVISSLEVRPLPRGAYHTGMRDFPNKSLRKAYRINSGYNESLRYPLDPYDRIWDADQSYTPFHVSSGFNFLLGFNLSSVIESPPPAVLQTARVLARTDVLTYNLPLDALGDYYIILYFAGIVPASPSFDVLVNGDVVQSNYHVKMSEASALHLTQKGIENLNITLKSISFYPQINAIEVYEIVDIPLESSSTTVSALQVIQQSTSLDLGWEDNSPIIWEPIDFLRELSDINLRDLHNTSLAGEIQNLESLQHLEKLYARITCWQQFSTESKVLTSLSCSQ